MHTYLEVLDHQHRIPMTAQIPIDHHFTPVFYLNAWTTDGRLIRYSRPYDKVVAKSCAPRRTGSEAHLYTLRGVPLERQAALETEFFQPIDDQAAIVHQMLRAGRLNDLTGDQRCHWARFMMSTTLRSPFSLAEVERLADQTVRANLAVDDDEYNAMRKPGDPATLYDWTVKHAPQVIENAHKSFLPGLIDHEDLGRHLINMVWATLDVSAANHTLLTSDRPFNWIGGWKDTKALLAFPLGPELLFLATNGLPFMRAMLNNPVEKVVRQVNESTARFAVDFIIGRDDAQLNFVETRLRRRDEEPLPGPIGRGQPNCPA